MSGRYATYQVVDAPLSKGGLGSIYRTSDPQLVYKEYHSVHKAPDRSALDVLVEIGREITVDRRLAIGDSPESSTNWPVDIVPDPAGRTRGVILPAIPPTLFNQFGKPRTLEFLIMARASPPAAQVRVVLLLRMAEILAFLNSRELVHGDINGKNLAWRETPTPLMYLIDCDGIVGQTPPPAVGVQALGWGDPRVVEHIVRAHDHYSDWYALALAMYRGLLLVPGNLTSKAANGVWPKPTKIPAQLDRRVADLLHRALDDPLDANARPSPAEWIRTLLDVYLPGGSYATTELRVLDRVSQPAVPFVPLPTMTQPTMPTVPLRPLQPPQPVQWPSRPPPQARPPQPMPMPPPTPRPVPRIYLAPAGPPVPPPRYPKPSNSPSWFGLHALRGTALWHLGVFALAFMCSPLGLVYLLVATIDVASVPANYPGRNRALIACACYAGLSALVLVVTCANSMLSGSTST